MNPAYSIIFFTTASGAGYGILAALGLYGWTGTLPESGGFAILTTLLGVLLVTAGLISSTYHLGHPERAWRAMTQWQTSWLSREGVAAVLTYVPLAVFAFFWLVRSEVTGPVQLAGLLLAVGAVLTVICTGMIYASLKAIPAWYSNWVPWVYLALGAMTGLLWIQLVAALFDVSLPGLPGLAITSVVLALLLKLGYWLRPTRTVATRESATGLGTFGGKPATVRLLDMPHTEENYLQKEMGYVVARKHAEKLREHAALLAFAVPLMFCVLGTAMDGALSTLAYFIAAVSVSVGVVVERWLFFAEATHAVTLYYDQSEV